MATTRHGGCGPNGMWWHVSRHQGSTAPTVVADIRSLSPAAGRCSSTCHCDGSLNADQNIVPWLRPKQLACTADITEWVTWQPWGQGHILHCVTLLHAPYRLLSVFFGYQSGPHSMKAPQCPFQGWSDCPSLQSHRGKSHHQLALSLFC